MSSPHDILAKGVDDDNASQMNVDQENLEEVAVAVDIAEKTKVFDKAPPPSTDEVLEPSIP